MSINPYSNLVIPNEGDLISSLKPLFQEGEEPSQQKTIQDGKIAEAVQKLIVFSKECKQAFNVFDKQKEKNTKRNPKARQRKITELKTAVSKVKEFTDSIQTKEKNLLEAIKSFSDLAFQIKEKMDVPVSAKKNVQRSKGKRVKGNGKKRVGKSKKKSMPKLIKKANAFFEHYSVNRQERILHLDARELNLEKLEALKTSSHPFLELMAKVNYCVSQDQPLDFDAAIAKCVVFFEDLKKNCSDEDLLGRISQVLGILYDKEQKMSKGFLQKKVFQPYSSIYFDHKEALSIKVKKATAKIEENKKNSILLRSAVDKLPLLDILRELSQEGIEQNAPLFNFLDPMGTIRVALILDEPSSYSDKVMTIVDLLTREILLREDCTWEEFGKFVAHWPLFLNIEGIRVGGLEVDPLQKELKQLRELKNGPTIKNAVEDLLILSQEPAAALHQFVLAYLLNFIDRQGTARVDFYFSEKVTGEAERYEWLAQELKSSQDFKELITREKGKFIGDKYRTEQFRQAVQMLLEQSVDKTEENELFGLQHILGNPTPQELVQGVLDKFAAGNFDYVNSLATCFKRLFVEKYLQFNPESFLSKQFKKEASLQEFSDLFNTLAYYLQYKVLNEKNNKKRGNILCGVLLTAKAAAEQGAINAATSMCSAINSVIVGERRFPEAWKIVNNNKDAKEALEWLNNDFLATDTKLAKFLEALSKEGEQLIVPSVTRSFNKMEEFLTTLSSAKWKEQKKLAKENIESFVNQKLFKDRAALSLWFDAWKLANSMNMLDKGFKQELAALSQTLGPDIEEELESLSDKLRKPKKPE